MLNMIRMELYRMFKTRSMYVIWLIFAAAIVFTTNLTITEQMDSTIEEQQEAYEYTLNLQDPEQVNFGMEVSPPTKPGETISVFDMFFANVKGKFAALFMVIFTVLYSTADLTSGYVKNIAGQVKNRRGLIYAKGAALLVYTVITMLLYVGIQALSNLIFSDKLVWGPVKEFALYAGLQTLLHFSFLMIVMCIAILIKNNAVSMVVTICMCMNILTVFYSLLEKMILRAGVKKFHVLDYTITGRISMLGMEISRETGIAVLLISIVFIVLSIAACSTIFKQRDI